MATENKNINFVIEMESLDSNDTAGNVGLTDGETASLESNPSALNMEEDNIKLETSDYVIKRNGNVDNTSNLTLPHENEINDEIPDIGCSFEDTEGNDVSLPTAGLVSPIRGSFNMCQTCGESFFSFQALQNHLKLHASRRDVKKAHMRAHAGEKPFVCNVCGNQFQDTGSLLTHMKIHKELSALEEVDGTEASKSDEKALIQHQCKICHNQFEDSDLLETHIEKTHSRISLYNRCCVCGKYCSTWYNLKKHTLTHFRDQKITLAPDQKKAQCQICYKLFPSYNDRKRHEELHKKYTHQNKPQCQFCFKLFSSNSTCKRHEKLHYNHKKTHRCQYCSKLFSNDYNRKRHEKHHNNRKHLKIKMKSLKKPSSEKVKNDSIQNTTSKALKSPLPFRKQSTFKCQVCDHVTKRFSDFKMHALRHFKHDKHNCGVCGQHFVYPGQLKRHWAKHLHNNKSKKLIETKNKTLESNNDKPTKMKMKSLDSRNKDKVTDTCTKQNLEDGKTSKTKENLIGVNGINPKDADLERLVCKICDRTFNARANLILHMKLHLSRNLHQCKICKQSFKLFCYLKVHLAKKHQVDHKSYKDFYKIIPVGSKQAGSDTGLGKSVNPNLSCQSCGKSFNKLRFLNIHLNNHCQPAKGCRCSICYKVFKDLAQLKVHSIKCTLVSRPYQCMVCRKRCATISNLRQHTAIHKKDNIKEETQNPYKIKNFAPNLDEDSKLKTMKKEPHFSQNEIAVGTFDCQICGKKFNSTRSLANHNRIHIKMTAKIASSKSKPVVEKTYYLCRLCDEAFEDSKLLKKHWKVHGNQEKHQEKPFQCKTCLKTFFDKDVLKWHETTHLQSRSYQCKICKVKVFGSETFKIHMQLHKVF